MTASGPAVGYRIHHRFAEALPQVPSDVIDRVWKLVEQLRRDPQAVRAMKGCKKVRGASLPLFEARVQDDWRIIWMNQPNGEPFLLMVGDHDHIFGDSARRIRPGELDDALADDPLSFRSSEPGRPAKVRERHGWRSAYHQTPALNLPFERIPDAMFSFWNVPETLAPVIRAFEDENALSGLIGELPDDTVCAILEFAKDGTIRLARDEDESTAAEVLLATAPADAPSEEDGSTHSPLGLTRELLVEMEVPDESIGTILAARSSDDIGRIALPLSVAQRLLEAITLPRLTGMAADVAVDLYAESQEDLQDYYTGDIKRLLFYLQPAQRDIVELPSPALHLIKGVAGSGKTTVALYRAKRLLAADPGARVLFLTYNKTLARTASELARDLLPTESADRLTVVNVHRWMTEFLRGRRGDARFASPDQRRRAMTIALGRTRANGAQSRILERPADWFLDEISHSIKGRGVSDLDAYLAIERTGRATALADAGRRLVWQVFEAYQDELGELCEWDDLPRLCLEELSQSDQSPAPVHVIVDEGQDLAPAALRLCIALAGPDNPSVLLLADAAQSIYRRGFRWKDIGVSLRGHQVHHLKNNYRNTLEILRLSNGFLERNPNLREDGEQGGLDENTPRRGPLPTLVACSGFKGEAQSIARRIAWLRTHKGVPYANVAVLAPWNKRLEYIAYVLREAGIPVVLHRDEEFSLGANCVKLATLHSAKGLEFPIVFIADVNDGVLPRAIDGDDEEAASGEAETARRLLYVGMTRAMQELYLTTTDAKRSPLIAELPTSAYQQVSGR